MAEKESSFFGAIGIFGRANAGKSTLVNALVKEKVSIVSPKPQTTRRRILGILTQGNKQLVLCDTPGLHELRNRLDEYMESQIMETLNGLHGAIYLVDSSDPNIEQDQMYFAKLFKVKKFPLLICLNKIDLVEKSKIEDIKKTYSTLAPADGIIEISALNGYSLDRLLEILFSWLPEGPHAYDPDYFTTMTEREIAAETIREAVLQIFYHEVPHSVTVQVDEFKERNNGKTYIKATLFVERESQKKILIGENGQGIKKLGTAARNELNRILGRDIFLELWVKVKPNWRKNADLVRQMGYR